MTASRKPEGFIDLGELKEDERIATIGHAVVVQGKTVSVLVDDLPDKIARYKRKLKEQFPAAVILDEFKGPIANVYTLKVGPQ